MQREKIMALPFGETLRRLRIEKGLSQQQLANIVHVERSSISNWEGNRRFPDVDMLSLLAKALDVDSAVLLAATEESDEAANIMLVDDERITLNEWLSVLREALPGANISGFTKPSEAIAFARDNPVAIAFLDIELGRYNGLDLCRQLLHIRSNTNVIFLTGYKEYSLDAWDTGACGFLVKPLTVSDVRRQLSLLRYPVRGLM